MYNKLKYTRVLEWGKLVTITGGTQAIIQGINLLSGILTIRLLSTHEYALYTLANTMLGTMTLLADGGISTGVMAQGGKVWQNKEKLGQVLITGLELRKIFALSSFLISIPLLLYLLIHHGASWLNAGSIVIALAPAFFAALSGAQLQVAPKLHQDIGTLQQNQLKTNLMRFGALCLSILAFPFSSVAILFSGLPQLWSNVHLRKASKNYVDWHQPGNDEIRKEILTLVRRMLPGIIYYCLSGQITIWLISFFGSTAAVAQVGALGRIAMVLTIISVLINTLVVPRFARIQADDESIINRFLLIQSSLVLLSGLVVFLFWFFPDQILFVLGNKYANLRNELVLNIIGSCLALISGSAFLLYSSRGIILNQIISIPVNVGALLIGCFLFNLATIQGVLLLTIFVSGIQLLMHNFFFILKIKNINNTK